jgi:hypothetical protein
MNLHGIAGPIIATVNPTLTALFSGSVGWTQKPDRSRVAAYSDPVPVPAQVQALTWKDLQQLDGLNLQGTKVGIYLYGMAAGAVRVNFKGGDLITITDGNWAGVYLTHVVLEQWPDWVKIACTLQNQPASTLPSGPALGNNPP